MAEAMNYRMNLVIDPKNVIKANRELRAMERYFERIQDASCESDVPAWHQKSC